MISGILSLIVLGAVFAVAILLLAYQALTGVPPLSASAAEADAIIALLKQSGIGDKAVIYDLGCGWGKIVAVLADIFPHAQIRGIERSPLPYVVARLRTCRRPNVFVQRADFYTVDLHDADAVTCYLMPKAMPKLAAYLDKNLAPSVPVVASAFWFRGRKISMTRGDAALYHWPASPL